MEDILSSPAFPVHRVSKFFCSFGLLTHWKADNYRSTRIQRSSTHFMIVMIPHSPMAFQQHEDTKTRTHRHSILLGFSPHSVESQGMLLVTSENTPVGDLLGQAQPFHDIHISILAAERRDRAFDGLFALLGRSFPGVGRSLSRSLVVFEAGTSLSPHYVSIQIEVSRHSIFSLLLSVAHSLTLANHR